MLHREVNRYGAISIDRAVVDGWIDQVFAAHRDKVWLAHYRGAVSDVMIRIGNIDALAESDVRFTEKGLFVRLYVVIRFGCSIREVTSDLMDGLADYLTSYLELPIDNIEVIVTGMLSKNIAKRHVKKDYRSLLNSRTSLR
ncbi:MAG: hypothetical protein ACOX4E_01850 [Anaerovoracaceae bacterium]|jgi:uncharacterized alkaline shock family protein YloU